MISKLFAILFLLSFTVTAYSQEKADTKCFIIFRDKGKFKPEDKIVPGDKAYETGKSILSERAINRRLKVLDENELISFSDLPLEESYVSGIKNSGIEIIAVSRWMNGVSAYLTEKQVKQIEELEYVDKVNAVKSYLSRMRKTRSLRNKQKQIQVITDMITEILISKWRR
ncbi:MAG: hypothetical protein R3A12_05455 [Ignavibacteria bacterium]